MEIKKDIRGIEPRIGDLVAFMIIGRKSMNYGTVEGFMKSGCPIVCESRMNPNKLTQSIKTDFAIIESIKN